MKRAETSPKTAISHGFHENHVRNTKDFTLISGRVMRNPMSLHVSPPFVKNFYFFKSGLLLSRDMMVGDTGIMRTWGAVRTWEPYCITQGKKWFRDGSARIPLGSADLGLSVGYLGLWQCTRVSIARSARSDGFSRSICVRRDESRPATNEDMRNSCVLLLQSLL